MGWNVQLMNHFTNNAHSATHVARSKAQHYVRKSCTKTKTPPNTRKFYVDSALIFGKTEKIATYLLSLNVWCLVRGILVLKHTQFQQFHAKILVKAFTDSIVSTLPSFFIVQRQGFQSIVGKEHFKAQKRAKICPRIASLSLGAIL